MENTTPNLITPAKPARRYSRTIALSVTGLALAIVFLASTGGFNALSRIFGSHAGTEKNLVFAGNDNFSGNKDASPWVKGMEVPAVMDGAGSFTSFTGVPDYAVEGATAGMVMPMVTSLDPTQDAFINHKYTSPALDLGADVASFNQVKIYAHIPEGAQINFSYRTALDITGLATAMFNPLVGTFSVLPENESAQVATVSFASAPSQFLQFQIDFQTFDATNRPAVFGFVIESATADGEVGIAGGIPESRTITLNYTKNDATPTVARVQVVSSDASLDPLYSQDGVNLANVDTFGFSLQLGTGAYAVVITSPTTMTKTVPFEVTGDPAIMVNLDAFEASAGGSDMTGAPSPDLNQDGSVNSLDATILMNAIGAPTP